MKHENANRVFLLNKDGKPLMPCRPRKARQLLKSGKAFVVKKYPFTIQLKYGSYG
ncbi:HNH endonuclease, partial [Lactobacillus delbrueckii subsp. lactis]